MRRDPRIVGSYLRQRDNLFAWIQTSPIVLETLHSLQKAGTIRKDVDAGVAAHIIEMLGYGQVSTRSGNRRISFRRMISSWKHSPT